MAQQNLAQDLFEDMGRKVAEASARDDDVEGSKVVDVIESLCMNCHEDVSTIQPIGIQPVRRC